MTLQIQLCVNVTCKFNPESVNTKKKLLPVKHKILSLKDSERVHLQTVSHPLHEHLRCCSIWLFKAILDPATI